MALDHELLDVGFELVADNRGSRKYARRSNPYLQWWVIVSDDGTAELQWELALGQYLIAKGFHISVQDELSLLLFPRAESRGPAEASWVAEEIARTEEILGAVDLRNGV